MPSVAGQTCFLVNFTISHDVTTMKGISENTHSWHLIDCSIGDADFFRTAVRLRIFLYGVLIWKQTIYEGRGSDFRILPHVFTNMLYLFVFCAHLGNESYASQSDPCV